MRFSFSKAGPVARVREMREADLEQVVAIEDAGNPTPWTRSQFQSSLRGTHHALVIASSDLKSDLRSDLKSDTERVEAFAVFSEISGEAEVLSVAVHPKQRRKGHAGRLLDAFLKQTASHCRHLFLEVRESNRAAQSFYEAYGFHQVGRRPRYYPRFGPRSEVKAAEDALIYALDIDYSSFDALV